MFTFAIRKMIQYPILNCLGTNNYFLKLDLFPLACEGRRNFFVHTKNSGCRFLLNQKQCLPLQQKLFIKLFNLTD